MTPLQIDRLLAAPSDAAVRAVIADELTEAGDPRGPLMALQCQATLDDPQRTLEARLLKRHRLELCGSLGPVVEERCLDVQRGVVVGVRVVEAEPATIRRAFAAPLARLLEWIDVEAVEARVAMELVRSLPTLTGVGGVAVESVQALRASHGAQLTRLGVVGTARYQLVPHPELLVALTPANFPALRTLRLGRHALVATLRPLLEQLPALTSLSVANIRNDRLVDGELAFADWVPVMEETPLETFELREDDGSGFWSTKLGWVVRFSRDERRRFSRMHAHFHKFPSRHVAPYDRFAQGLRRWMGTLTEVHVSGLRVEPHQRAELEAFFSAVPAVRRSFE